MRVEYHNENFDGTLDFRSKIKENWRVSLHLHEYSEILYCKKGAGEILINGRSIKLSERQFVWIPPNYVHALSFDDAEVVCAVFSNDFIPLFTSALSGRHLVVSPIASEDLTDMLDRLYLLKREEYLKISGVLYMISEKVLLSSELRDDDIMDGVLFQKVMAYLSEHYTEDINLATLAKKFGYNEKYLSHTLHSVTGIHFSRLISFYRVEHAKRLLSAEPQKSIAVVACESGFAAMNTFHRAFLKQVGVTPYAYRHSFKEK